MPVRAYSRWRALAFAVMVAAVTVAGCDGRSSATVQNRSGRDVRGLSLTVGEESFRLGPLAAGESRSISFDPGRDASLTLCIDREGQNACSEYGYVTPGLIQTHIFDVLPDAVTYVAR